MFHIKAFLALPLIELKPGDRNGTGYFDGLVYRKLDTMSRAIDEHGRNILIIPTPIGNLVAFQRFTGNNQIICFNTPPRTRHIFYTAASGIEFDILEDRLLGKLEVEEQQIQDYLKAFHFTSEADKQCMYHGVLNSLEGLGWKVPPRPELD